MFEEIIVLRVKQRTGEGRWERRGETKSKESEVTGQKRLNRRPWNLVSLFSR